MDDLLNGLTPKAEATLKEMARKSQDRIKVANPTDSDFEVRWDSYVWKVPAHGESVFPRYIAINFMGKLIDKILQDQSDERVLAENERRKEKGNAIMNKWEEQMVFESAFKINNPELRRPLMKQIWLGIEEHWGMNQSSQEPIKAKDERSVDEQLLDELDNTRGAAPITKPESNSQDLVGLKQPELRKIARERGIETEKTDKVNDLLAKLS